MDQVPIANRYNGAWAEINARLQARQNVNITFTTIAAAAIAAMWSERSYYDAVYFFLPLNLAHLRCGLFNPFIFNELKWKFLYY